MKYLTDFIVILMARPIAAKQVWHLALGIFPTPQ
jgi:hypothetical protein